MKRLLLTIALLLFSSFAIAAVNINTASKEELDVLPGIGPVKAQAIVDYRKANGPFKSVDDLKKVNGIGDATFDKLKGDITVSGGSKAAPKAAAAAPAKAEPAKTAAPAPAPAKAEPAKTTAAAPAAATPAKAEPAKVAAPAATPAPATTAKVKDAAVKQDAAKK